MYVLSINFVVWLTELINQSAESMHLVVRELAGFGGKFSLLYLIFSGCWILRIFKTGK
jgi:hypothetical protein